MNRRIAFVFLGLVLGIGLAWLIGDQIRTQLAGAAISSGQQSGGGRALVGGPFSLTNHLGQAVTEKDFLNQYMLVYFGYTYCPDICPGELQNMIVALDILEQKGFDASNVQPILISIDPERDTVAALNQYVGLFHPRLVGLTGTADEVREAARAYRVYYQRAEGDDTVEYLMDHSSIVFLMSREGEYLAHFGFGTSAESMADGISKHLVAGDS